MAAIITFSGSLLALIAFLCLKHWESVRGRPFAASLRQRLDVAVETLERFVRHEIPLIAASVTRLATAATMRAALHSLRIGFLFISRKLHRLIEAIEGRSDLRKKGSASFFLRSLNEHKKGLERPSASQ